MSTDPNDTAMLDAVEVCGDNPPTFDCGDREESSDYGDGGNDHDEYDSDNYGLTPSDPRNYEPDNNHDDPVRRWEERFIGKTRPSSAHNTNHKPQEIKSPLSLPEKPSKHKISLALAKLITGSDDVKTIDERYKFLTTFRGGFKSKRNHSAYHISLALNKVNDTLVNAKTGHSKLNISTITLEKYYLEVEKANTQLTDIKEISDAINTVLGAYKDLYEKQLDTRLAQHYKKLAENFTYSPQRIEKAKRRHVEFLQNRRFRVSHEDRKILNDLENLNKFGQLQANAGKLNVVAKSFGLIGKAWTAVDLVVAFNQAQRTKDWGAFIAKIEALGTGMLIGSISALGIAAGSLPAALIAATFDVVASFYLEDEELWQNINQAIKHYLE